MPKIYEGVTERLLKLPVGKSCVLDVPKLNVKAAQKHAPDGQWRSQAVDGRILVTRVR